MEKHCVMVSFSARESKKNKKGESPIEMSISINGERVHFNTGKFVKVEDWDKKKQSVKGKSDSTHLLNAFLVQLRNKVYRKEIELVQNGFIVTAAILRDAVLDKVDALNEKTLFELVDIHNNDQEALVGNGISKATYWVSVYTRKLLKEYVASKYRREDLYLRELNINFIMYFHTFLKTEKGMAQNSCTKHLKLLKKIVNQAVANSYMTSNPFFCIRCYQWYIRKRNRKTCCPRKWQYQNC